MLSLHGIKLSSEGVCLIGCTDIMYVTINQTLCSLKGSTVSYNDVAALLVDIIILVNTCNSVLWTVCKVQNLYFVL